MRGFVVKEDPGKRLRIKGKRPYISGFLAGLLALSFGIFFILYTVVASPDGFFRSLKSHHLWMFWMFGILFFLMGVFIVVGAIRNLIYPFTCTLDKSKGTLRIWPVPFSEKGLFQVPLSQVLEFEVIESLKAWTEHVQHFKNQTLQEQNEWVKKFPHLLKFAQLKLEELRLRQIQSPKLPKDMVPRDDQSHEQNTAPRLFLRLKLKNNQFVLLDWLGAFKGDELEDIALRLNQFHKTIAS